MMKGVFGCPTTVANVETVAVAPVSIELYILNWDPFVILNQKGTGHWYSQLLSISFILIKRSV